MTDLDIQELATLTAGDADVDNFERLFTKLKQMKGIFKKGKGQKKKVERLTFILLHRKSFFDASWAEESSCRKGIIDIIAVYFPAYPQSSNRNCVFQVAKAFWMAIGGDDDEIEGLSSGEES